MTNTMNDHITTIALARANHPRVRREVLKGNRDNAREALRQQIENTLAQSQDPLDRPDMNAAIRNACDTLNACPGPVLLLGIARVVKAVIPD
jgi:hypothetical protein